MDVFLIFCAGAAFLAGILALKPLIKMKNRKMAVLQWALYGLWYFATCLGISFVVLNSRVGHVKATSTAIFLFLGLSAILVVILARTLGVLGKNGFNFTKKVREGAKG